VDKSEVGICKSIFTNQSAHYDNCLAKVADLSKAEEDAIYCCGRYESEDYLHFEYCCSYEELVSQHR